IQSNAKQPQPRKARLLCEVTDLDQQTVSAEHDFTVDSSDFYFGIRQMPNVVHEGESVSLSIVAVRPDGQPVSESIQTQVRVTRIDWQTNQVEGAGNASNYRSEPEYQVVSEISAQTSPVVKHGHKWAIDDGTAGPFAFTAGKPGEYLIEVSAKDAGGRPIVTTTNLFVYGPSETVWNYRNPFQIDLVPDKESYLVGDRAIILVKTPISGDALVTVERENVRRSFVERLSGNAPAIEIPLEQSDAPNVYVSVMLLRGADESTHQIKKPEYRVGYARLTVERPEAKLRVYVQPDRPTHEPGEPVAISAEVLDHLGKPVSDAELTLYAVDEGVLSLTGYETPDLSTYFNAERGLAVYTGLTLPQLLSEDPDERQYANKGFLVGGGGEDRIRKNFLACAFWAGTLKTGPDGRVTANFTAPDGLTRYRLMAVAQTAKNQFGSGESSLEINKPVMIEPAPPRFGNVGDKMLLRALVHNTTDFAGRAEIDFVLDDTVSAQETHRPIELAARGSAAVDLPVEFVKAGEAVWKWKLSFLAADGATVFHDAAEVKLHVGYPTPATREVRLVKVNQRETNLLDQIEPKLLQGAAGTVTVSISNSRVLELGEAIHDLLHYPYGCVEQTTSSTLPWITLRDFRDSLPDLRESDENIERMVAAGVNRLLTMQTESGGLAYWPGETQPLLWASAYGGLGLIEAKNAGYSVPKENLERLWSYMREALRGAAEANEPAQFSERCLALYTLALAGRAEPAYQEVLFEKRAQLSRENRSLLALAILRSGGARSMAAELLDSIENAPVNAEDFHWFGSESRAIATELLASVRFDPKGAEVQRLVADLFARSAHGRWLTTQGNAWAILAFAEYVRESKSLAEKVSGDVICGADTKTFSIDKENHAVRVVWPLSAAAKAGGISIVDPEEESCFAEVQIESHPSMIEESQSEHGYTLSRHYYKLSRDGKLEPLHDLTVGDRVVVALDLEVKDFAEYLALDDSLPAVLEAINPAFKTQATTDGDLVNGNWFDDYHELRADRALFFRDHIWPGNYTICYLARVRAAGTVTAPAARVQEMYHPERFGQTETMQVTASPLR
ncbi:MAG TPA: alpha-2-macroglobulin family protein, partial [Chthoniobacteraceae bacterium]